ncbi:MAG: RdgB/HAM1 family non-canonical purine NTP pyrophosphatase [Micrococcales bacterium]|nr:RdgB/HAM1 family non-canonical purine NTP pyrophosphatase [Micrococcales bacterium]
MTATDQGLGPDAVVLATHNQHKLAEVRAILGAVGLDPGRIVSAADLGAPEPVEDGLTFADNALIKARALVAATGRPAMADDSGLVVDVLGGAPGIFSARWCGHHGDDAANLRLLLDQLADVPDPHRTARFRCAAVLVTPDGTEVVEHGDLDGRLTTAPRGVNGFGYDPVLVPTGEQRTCAELTAEEKNARSHRGRAFRALAPAVVRALV